MWSGYFLIPVPCEKLDDRAGRLGAKQHALRTADHLHPIETAGAEMGVIERAAGFGKRHAVQQHQCRAAPAAAREHAGDAAVVVGLRDAESSDIPQHVRHERILARFKIARGEDVRCDARFRERHRRAGRRDHHAIAGRRER